MNLTIKLLKMQTNFELKKLRHSLECILKDSRGGGGIFRERMTTNTWIRRAEIWISTRVIILGCRAFVTMHRK
jgi:hypothetical protein